jgi:hypothetical protein
MLTDPSGVDKPLPLRCPKCGGLLSVHDSRLATNSDGQPEWVHIYLCFKDGFFTFTDRKGLQDGL